ncbi:MAG TPA: hypothetical protein VGM11_07760 [Acidobacteriaceae bacterium]|jgi:sugar lactone lactonase YvrE
MKPNLRLRIFLQVTLLAAPCLVFIAGCSSSSNANVVVVAGDGIDGSGGDGGPAIRAQFNSIFGVAVDSSGNFYVADAASEVVRKVTVSTGIISTVAGSGVSGYAGDDGPATKAKLDFPFGIALDRANNLYIADRGNNVVRRVDASTGIITTIGGDGLPGFSGDGGLATKASLNTPENIAFDSAGNLYLTDFANSRVREISAATGIIRTVAGGGSSLQEDVAATSASIHQIDCVAVDAGGNLYVCDRDREGVREIDAATGTIHTIAGNGNYGESGNGGPATSAEMSTPYGIAFTASGAMLVVDYAGGTVREIDAAGRISQVARFAAASNPTAIAAGGSGQFYVSDSGARVVREISGVQ